MFFLFQWQQTDDFGRKKEIRARMYKLREQRLREFYTTGEVLRDVLSSNCILDDSPQQRIIGGSASDLRQSSKVLEVGTIRHADSLADEGFLSLKSKEIRDSESPTRDFHATKDAMESSGGGGYWKVMQQSSSGEYSSSAATDRDGNTVVHSSTRNQQLGLAADSENDGVRRQAQVSTIHSNYCHAGLRQLFLQH